MFNHEENNVALPKDKFAQTIYKGEIEISDKSWEKFDHIFKKIEEILNNVQQKNKKH